MTRQYWTEPELAILRQLYPATRAKDIVPHLPRWSITQILGKAWRMGLKKPVETIRQHARESIQDPHHGARATQFKPGQTTWNAGRKGWQAGGRSVETQFKKGHRGGVALEVYQPIGTERLSKDGYLQRKVNDDMPLQRRWRAVHVLIWEAANGPLPKGHIVIFIDGNKQHIALDNLRCISQAENMRRNTVHNLPKPVAELVLLRGAIVRKINRLTQDSHDQPHAD